jgi:signal-transduction protein with cAMP-binding, CBS, and nucleotidyltransferase domain
MKIKDRPEFKNKAPAFALRSDEMASAAIKTLAERNIGSVVIVDDDMKVRGIVTERDLVKKLLGGGLDPKTTPLSRIMTTDVRTAHPGDQVIDWLRLMSNERFRHLPVVDDDGRLINILSQGDFVSYTWPELLLNFREKTSETLRGPAAPLPILIGGIMLYTLLIIAVLRTF